MVLRERCCEQSSAIEFYIARIQHVISTCPGAAFLPVGTLTFEPWGAIRIGGMAFINEILAPFCGDKCLPSLFPHPSDSGDLYTCALLNVWGVSSEIVCF